MPRTDEWNTMAFRLPAGFPTMLTREECRYLYWLGKTVWKGTGIIVEIGPWLGGSTLCLANGMSESGRPVRKKLHVIDNFIWREFMERMVSLPLRPGESFEPYFLKNLENFRESIVVYRRTLPDENLEHDRIALKKRYQQEEPVPLFERLESLEPVEILFIDGAKSWKGMKTLLIRLSEQLIPGGSLLVCQDFKYWETYWVPLMMERLRDYVEPVHNVEDGTTVSFRLQKEIPGSVLETFEDHVADIDTKEGLEYLRAASKQLSELGDEKGSRHVGLSRVAFLAHQGKTEKAVNLLHGTEAEWPRFSDTRQLRRAHRYVEELTGKRFAVPPTLQAGAYLWNVQRRFRDRFRRVLGGPH